MRAAIMRAQRLVVDDLAAPEPRAGEVLVRTLACGICGSDLHALRHAGTRGERTPLGSALRNGLVARRRHGPRVLRRAQYADPAKAPPRPPWLTGPSLRPAVIFECVGVPGLIGEIMVGAPASARVVVVGVCMKRDSFEPMLGINKELNLQFVLGYSPEEFADTLHSIADEKLRVEPLLTGKVGVEGVAEAFDELASPEHHAKILVEPWR